MEEEWKVQVEEEEVEIRSYLCLSPACKCATLLPVYYSSVSSFYMWR